MERHLLRKGISLGLILAAAAAGTLWALAQARHARIHVSTDDAYVRGPMVTVAFKVPGRIRTLQVRENEEVRAGQVLATLDVDDLDAAVDRARASVDEAGAGLGLQEAQVAQARAQVAAAEGAQRLAEADRRRFTALAERQSIPLQKRDQAVAADEVATATLAAARKQVAVAEGALAVARGKAQVARAALAQARIQREHAVLTAPCAGVVSRKLAEPGMVAAAGQPLLALVPLGASDLWVEANFKETQLSRLRPGQPVEIRADAFEGRALRGEVESLSAGTGSAFSLLPAENATGNWVKVVQRLPVRIRLASDADPGGRLRVGLSVTATVDTRD